VQTYKVLLADDSSRFRKMLRTAFEEEGIQVAKEASDGIEAIRMLEELLPDVMILDLVMPGLSGMDVLARVPEISPGTRVIVLTALDSEKFAAAALEAGAADFLVKPIDPREVLLSIKKALAAG